MPIEKIPGWHERIWLWFTHHAEGPQVLPLLALVSFSDAIISPLAAEVYLAALMAAHPRRWVGYLSIAILFSTAGAVVGYFFAHFLFQQFGQAIINFYNLQAQFIQAQELMRGHVFLTVSIGSALPLPDKVFIYAAGFLGVKFVPYIIGYFIGRGVRMAVVTYLAGLYGKKAVDLFFKYTHWFLAGLALLIAIYGIVHFRILPL